MTDDSLESNRGVLPDHHSVRSRNLISICIPAYNEEENIPALLARLRTVAQKLAAKHDFEFLFTDDGSTDRTYELLVREAQRDHRIRILRLSRNFGFQRNVLVNFLNARGDAALEIDADLQDPPELIGEFLALWEKGYKVVYGIRAHRNEGRVITWMRKIAYRMINKISEVPVPVDAGDFRLVDRVIIEHLRTLTDRNPYLRGAIAALGYPQIGVNYDRPKRAAGESKFPLLKLIRLGIDGVTSQSTRPLHYITLIGFGLSLVTGVLAIIYFGMWLLQTGREVRGFTTLVLLQLFAISMNALLLGIMGEYISRIFDNVRGHPFAIIEKAIEKGAETAYPPPDVDARPVNKQASPEPPASINPPMKTMTRRSTKRPHFPS
jgi:dolichol-phosphate mannosyltransferase